MTTPVKCSECDMECLPRYGGWWCPQHGWEVSPTKSMGKIAGLTADDLKHHTRDV